MAQIDFYELFGLSDLEIPLLKAPADEIPEWVIQIALAVVIFVILQALMVIIAGLFSRGEREEEFSQHPPNPWER